MTCLMIYLRLEIFSQSSLYNPSPLLWGAKSAYHLVFPLICQSLFSQSSDGMEQICRENCFFFLELMQLVEETSTLSTMTLQDDWFVKQILENLEYEVDMIVSLIKRLYFP